MTLLVIFALGGFVWYVMEPDERHRALRTVTRGAGLLRRTLSTQKGDLTPFDAALRERTRYASVTVGVAAIQVLVFLLMLVGPGTIADPSTLVSWGGNFGPNTTNGGWNRLVTSLFVHSGPLHLIVNVAALAQLGLILERLVGHLTMAVVFLTAGILAGLVSLYTGPVEVAVGASGAVFGLYGFLLAAVVWGLVHRSPLTIPAGVLKTLGPTAAVFLLYNAIETSVSGTAEWVAFAAGLVTGLLLTRDLAAGAPPFRPVAVTAAGALVLTLASGVALRGITNVRPELERLVATEARLAADYDKVVRQFRLGRITAAQLAQTIERTIRPELEAARVSLDALTGVPAEHAPLVSEAETYLALRGESWRTRADALRRGDMKGLRAADRTERASLQVFERLAAALRAAGGQEGLTGG